ncbi:MAG TPA: hypothetical protein VEL07_22395 [Planctomycetota bacterium]|nr:hypothetical protein [Planctomycetota bacterium]
MRLISPLALVLLSCAALAAVEERVLTSFEEDADIAKWEIQKGTAKLSDQHVTHGKRSLQVASDEYMVAYRLPGDWSGFDSVEIDFFVDGTAPVGVSLLIGDQAWKEVFDKASYWNRHNSGFTLKPGKNAIAIPVNGLFRGEAGSRNNDIKTMIDPTKIVRLDFGFKSDSPATIWIDNMRLTKEDRPEGILAFDFGPEAQTVFPGFTAITWNHVHGQEGRKAGLRRNAASANRARDDTFPTRLYQDYLEVGTDKCQFIADVANGTWHCWVMYSDCGYWGGEAARHKRRAILAEGKEVDVDDRGEAGPADWLVRFEAIEPKPGDSVWDLYLKSIFTARRFTTQVADGQLTLDFTCDAAWSQKIAAMVIYPDAKKKEAESWIATIEARNRAEAEGRAVFMGPHPKELAVPKDAQGKGWWLGYPDLAEAITFVDAPGAAGDGMKRAAPAGVFASSTFAIRPLRDYGAVTVTAGELKGPAGAIPASAVEVRYAHHQLRRGFNDVAYSIVPIGLRTIAGAKLELTRDLTRQFWVAVDIPANAKPGVYSGEVAVTAGGLKTKVPLTIEVLDLRLAELDFPIGFFGLWAPDELRGKDGTRELMTLMRRYGVTSYSGGPGIGFHGFDEKGEPKLDFTALDAWFATAREVGFTHEVFGYGGPGWVDGLDGGPHREAWEASGKTHAEMLAKVWGAVFAHAKAANWPQINHGMIDEPRVIETAQELAANLKALHAAVPELRIGGFYSVHWDESPLSLAIQDIFKTVTWSALGDYREIDMAKGKEFGREMYMYNQGADRHTFGLYTWARMNQGMRGLMNWHTSAISGYQYFDLDGREPDFAMVQHGVKETIPSLALARCREGIIDLRYAVTLAAAADAALKAKPDDAAAKEAKDWLDGVTKAIPPGTRDRPAMIDGDEGFRNGCLERLQKLK